MGLRLSGFLALLHLLIPGASWARPGEIINVPDGSFRLGIGSGMPMLDRVMANLSKLAATIRFDRENDGFARVGSREPLASDSVGSAAHQSTALIDVEFSRNEPRLLR